MNKVRLIVITLVIAVTMMLLVWFFPWFAIAVAWISICLVAIAYYQDCMEREYRRQLREEQVAEERKRNVNLDASMVAFKETFEKIRTEHYMN